MLSKSCKYGIRAVLHLAKNPTEKLGSKRIAQNLDIPAAFLAKTLQELSKKQIISSTKGPNGGFYLSDENKNRKIIDIIKCIDGELVFDKCFLGNPKCNSKNPCKIHHIYVTFKEKILTIFSDFNLVDLTKEDVILDKILE